MSPCWISEVATKPDDDLLCEFQAFVRQVRGLARQDEKASQLMTAPGAGPIVAHTYASAIDDPGRFSTSKQVGAHSGLTPRAYQSGETDYSGRISKSGDAAVRAALFEAAHIILTKPLRGCVAHKSRALRIARRAGPKKPKVALARKLAVILHCMLADGTDFNAERGPTATA